MRATCVLQKIFLNWLGFTKNKRNDIKLKGAAKKDMLLKK